MCMNLDPGAFFVVELSSFEFSRAEAKLLRELSPAGVLLGRGLSTLAQKHAGEYLERLQGCIERLQELLDRERFVLMRPLEASLIAYPDTLGYLSESLVHSTPDTKVLLAACENVKAQAVNLLLGPRLDRMVHEGDVSKILFEPLVKELKKSGIACCPGVLPLLSEPHYDPQYPAPVVSVIDEQYEELIQKIEPWTTLFPAWLMLGNVFLPMLEKEFPVSVSSITHETMLREHLGYTGLTIAPFPSKALIQSFATEDILLMQSFRAGLHMWVCSYRPGFLETCIAYKRELMKRMKTDETIRTQRELALAAIERILRTLSVPSVDMNAFERSLQTFFID